MRLLQTRDVLFVRPASELLPKNSNVVRIGAEELVSDDMLGNLPLIGIDDSVAIEVKSLGQFVIFLADPTIAILQCISELRREGGAYDIIARVGDRRDL